MADAGAPLARVLLLSLPGIRVRPLPDRTRTPQLPLADSALTGAIIVVGADLVARTALPPLEIPVGALTSLVGDPYLLWLLGREPDRGARASR
ncbi:iron chelate uptake ABC transporter family permease subunit [Streptomyces avermitilis]|uniref:iron chelate uptake ABC transporter family permease subunit n=1 Tax=Streptomyces avermitilis TaxID=33903 RepID=UPI003F4D409B